MCIRDSYVNIVLQLRYESDTTLRRFRVTLTRNGIESINEVEID